MFETGGITGGIIETSGSILGGLKPLLFLLLGIFLAVAIFRYLVYYLLPGLQETFALKRERRYFEERGFKVEDIRKRKTEEARIKALEKKGFIVTKPKIKVVSPGELGWKTEKIE